MEEDTTYYLQDEYLEVDSDDDFVYEEVAVDDTLASSGEEDLETALQNARATRKPTPLISSAAEAVPTVTHPPEVVEDFVRNFLVKMGMTRTAECFQAEWYELVQTGRLKTYHSQQHLPDVYCQNRQLEAELLDLQQELQGFKEAASLAKEKYIRVKKERDYHRMHHRRVLQEKDRLLASIKRMKQHFSTYEPMLQELRQKYETVTKEKMLACLERDRATSEVGCLQSTLQSVQKDPHPGKGNAASPLHANKQKQKESRKAKLHEFPPEPSNPHRHGRQVVCAHLTRTGGLQQSTIFQAHEFGISSVCLHPTKEVLVTTSDDHTWKMWALPSGDLLMTGEGHSDWLAGADFHPTGLQLATASGDGSVKVWDFSRGQCSLTFSEHQQPVWGCSWHWSGDFLASGGMDHCCKVWDGQSGQCVVTLRGHADSVNAVRFLPFSNTLCTCSADKTISLWDARTGLCVQTYYGHQHSCNDVRPTFQGWDLFSCDCFGTVLHWDLRTHTTQGRWDFGPYAINSIAPDPAGVVLACAGADNLIKLLESTSGKEWALEGHSDSVLDVCFNHQANRMVSCASDGQVIIWQ